MCRIMCGPQGPRRKVANRDPVTVQTRQKGCVMTEGISLGLRARVGYPSRILRVSLSLRWSQRTLHVWRAECGACPHACSGRGCIASHYRAPPFDENHRRDAWAARCNSARPDAINVTFFDGSEKDAFVLAVESNVQHGLLLTLSDRTAAAGRIVNSHPEWSDRAVAAATGLAAKTVVRIADGQQLGKFRSCACGLGRGRQKFVR